MWQTLGLTFILMSSGLQGVPDELHEAAEVDGAGALTRFWRVTLPMLSPTIFFAVVVGGIFAFQTFGQIDLLTQGGPLKRTNVLTYYIYDTLRSGEQRREGRGARDRALLPHPDPGLAQIRAARAEGATMTAEAVRHDACRRRKACGHGGPLHPAHLLALIVMFPIYITLVNSLLRPRRSWSSRRSSSRTDPQLHSYRDAWNVGHMAPTSRTASS